MYLTMLALVIVAISPKVWRRLQLSKAKHRSLSGHSKWSRRLSKLVVFFSYEGDQFFGSDGAKQETVQQRRASFNELNQRLTSLNSFAIATGQQLKNTLSDVDFTRKYRVPFPYREGLPESFTHTAIALASDDVKFKDSDDHWRFDLFSSYGVNVLGYNFYKECFAKAQQDTKDLGFILGPYHPYVEKNAHQLKRISGLDEVSFHMSGTEAVMQAIRLARYHTKKTHVVRLCGAYHGWWDGVQPGIGNRRTINDVYTLADLSEKTLTVLKTRNDIACIIINGMQAMHPNRDAPNDSSLINSARKIDVDTTKYRAWLHQIQAICNERGIVFIVDEIFTGFRLAKGGAQEYFDIQGDLVTYGKTLGGGLPIGVVCGRKDLMKRYRKNAPADVSLARGTFNSHPLVMATMHNFLTKIDDPVVEDIYDNAEAVWNMRIQHLNDILSTLELPIRLANMHSVLSVCYTTPSRYNWMLQFYLRANGLEPGWVGTGRFIMSLATTDQDWAEITQKIITAASEMKQGGWWDAPKSLTNTSINRMFAKDSIKALISKLKGTDLPTKKQDTVLGEL